MAEVLRLPAADFDTDPGIGAIVITGSAKAFADGADIKEVACSSFSEVFDADFAAPWENLAAIRTPLIAADRRLGTGRGLRTGHDVRHPHRRRHHQIRPTRSPSACCPVWAPQHLIRHRQSQGDGHRPSPAATWTPTPKPNKAGLVLPSSPPTLPAHRATCRHTKSPRYYLTTRMAKEAVVAPSVPWAENPALAHFLPPPSPPTAKPERHGRLHKRPQLHPIKQPPMKVP